MFDPLMVKAAVRGGEPQKLEGDEGKDSSAVKKQLPVAHPDKADLTPLVTRAVGAPDCLKKTAKKLTEASPDEPGIYLQEDCSNLADLLSQISESDYPALAESLVQRWRIATDAERERIARVCSSHYGSGGTLLSRKCLEKIRIEILALCLLKEPELVRTSLVNYSTILVWPKVVPADIIRLCRS